MNEPANRASLMAKLEQETLTPQEACDGVRECFVITHRAFMEKRQPERSTDEIDAVSNELVLEVYREQALAPETITPAMLRYVIRILNSRFDFLEDPDLSRVHHSIIAKLLEKPIGPPDTASI